MADDWETPDWLFRAISDRWGPFTLDVAATAANTKCSRFSADGLAESWEGESVWCNPPFSRVGEWTQKAAESGSHVVMLVPANTGTDWWARDVSRASELVFIRRKFPFVGARWNPPFYCVLVVFYAGYGYGPPVVTFWDPRRGTEDYQ